MPLAYPSIRVDSRNPLHHLWRNNGHWWLHATVHFGYRKRRLRFSLGTRSLSEAIQKRDEFLQRITSEGLEVSETRRSPEAWRSPTPV